MKLLKKVSQKLHQEIETEINSNRFKIKEALKWV